VEEGKGKEKKRGEGFRHYLQIENNIEYKVPLKHSHNSSQFINLQEEGEEKEGGE